MLQVIIHRRALRRIGSKRFIHRHRCTLIAARPHAVRCSRTKQPGIRRGNVRVHLPQRRHIIEHPKRSTERRDHQIVLMHHQVAHRRHRQTQLQRLPVVPVIKRNVNPFFSARIQQPFSNRIFPHAIQEASLGYSIRNALPRLAEISRAIEMRAVIFQPVPVHRRIRCPRIGVRCLHVRYLAPRRQLHEPIVRPRPDLSRPYVRRPNRVNHPAPFSFWSVRRRRRVQVRRHSRVLKSEIRTDDLPRIPAVRRSKQYLRPEVQHMLVDRRKHQRQRPRTPVFARMHKRRRHLLHLLVAKILTRDRPSILHSRIQRVRRDVSILISRFHRPPIMKIQ